VILLRADLM